MLKTVKALVNESSSKKMGNHAVTRHTGGRRFLYHGNIVCRVNDDSKTFVLDDCGWSGYPSTTRTLNSYRNALTEMGYREVVLGGNHRI